MTKTGITATTEEIETLRSIARRGWMPGDVIIIPNMESGIRRDAATRDAQWACHNLALKHGLPEFEGFYGILESGEFVRP